MTHLIEAAAAGHLLCQALLSEQHAVTPKVEERMMSFDLDLMSEMMWCHYGEDTYPEWFVVRCSELRTLHKAHMAAAAASVAAKEALLW